MGLSVRGVRVQHIGVIIQKILTDLGLASIAEDVDAVRALDAETVWAGKPTSSAGEEGHESRDRSGRDGAVNEVGAGGGGHGG